MCICVSPRVIIILERSAIFQVPMTSTIHHPVAVPSRGLIICEMEDESSEPKTILEIGGVSRPRPTYIIPTPTRPHPLPPAAAAAINNQPYMGHWKAQHDIVPSPYPAFTEFQEQKIVRLSNANWSGAIEKLPIHQPPSSATNPSKGIGFIRIEGYILVYLHSIGSNVNHFLFRKNEMLNADFFIQ